MEKVNITDKEIQKKLTKYENELKKLETEFNLIFSLSKKGITLTEEQADRKSILLSKIIQNRMAIDVGYDMLNNK